MRRSKSTPRGDIENVPLGKMRYGAGGQREIKRSRVDYLVSEMELELIGLPVVNLRRGLYYILDGQHRIEALKVFLGKGWEDQEIECRVYKGLTERQEARMFDRMNNVLRVSTYAKFMARFAAGESDESAICAMLEKEGLCISRNKSHGGISAVGALLKTYQRTDHKEFAKTLRIIRDSFGDAGFEASVINGLGHLCQRYNGVLDEKTATTQLSKTHGGVKGLLGRAMVIRDKHGSSFAHSIAAAAVDVINKNQSRGKKLPSWWRTE